MFAYALNTKGDMATPLMAIGLCILIVFAVVFFLTRPSPEEIKKEEERKKEIAEKVRKEQEAKNSGSEN